MNNNTLLLWKVLHIACVIGLYPLMVSLSIATSYAQTRQLPWGSQSGTFVRSTSNVFGDGLHRGRLHFGLDFNWCGGDSDCGKDVSSVACGVVSRVACSGKAATMGFGCHVEVTHNEGKRSFYAHLQERSAIVEDGDFVCRGERLALVGKTGLKRPKPNEPPGPGNPEPTCHIHFQMQDGNITKNSTKTIDPAPLRGFGPISPPANCADLPSIEFCQSLTSFPSGRHFTACGERDCCGQGGPQ